MTLPLRRKRPTTQPNTPAEKPCRGFLLRSAVLLPAALLPVVVAFLASLPPALFGDERIANGQLVDAEDPSRLDSSDPEDCAAPLPRAHRSAASGSTATSIAVSNEEAPRQISVRSETVKSAAETTRVPDMRWKGAFRSGARALPKADASVVQTSATLPASTVRIVAIPTPTPTPTVATDGPDATPLRQAQPAEPPPPPVKVERSTPGATQPTLEKQLAAPVDPKEKCLTTHDLRSINKITADINVKPEDLEGNRQLPPECPLGDTPLRPRHWQPITFAWTAAGTCHNPVYFDDEQLERYGHSWGPVKQTAISAVKFFAKVPLLPYYMGVNPPNECIYDLGQYRPGSCAPYYLDPLPLSVRGALYEGMFLGLLPAL
jgi:hypothetical protein